MAHQVNLQRLSKKDRKRERAKVEMAKITAAVEENQCRNKIQHDNWLDAAAHCEQLMKSFGVFYTVYHCETCDFAHVGHVDSPTITWMCGAYAEVIDTKL